MIVPSNEKGNKLADDVRSPTEDSFLAHRKIRAPQQHGEKLQDPPAAQWESIWNRNLSTEVEENDFQFGSLPDLIQSGREEIVEAAFSYTRQYRDISLDNRDRRRVVMAGHQPTLFHPGVWCKNFALSALGERFASIPINLVVDNDTSDSNSITVPRLDDGQVSVERVPFDDKAAIVSYESREIVDRGLFESFADRVSDVTKTYVSSPIIRDLWPLVIANSQTGNLGESISRGRHLYEEKIGLQSLELPISQLAETKSFATFAREILFRADKFLPVYNQTVERYRLLNGVRSRSHPVPNLVRDGDWVETPFWIWNEHDLQRRSLYVKPGGNTLCIADRKQLELSFELESFVDKFAELSNQEIRIRPKALMTTLFSRLVASDLFLHGIGGAKYDQLTDAICHQFFGVTLPEHLTISATMHLQGHGIPQVTAQQISKIANELRQLQFQPERFLDPGASSAEKWISAKQQWLATELPAGQRLARHQGIVECNENLQTFVRDKATELQQEQTRLKDLLASSRAINSRELSFCLFEQALVEELRV